MSAFAVLHHPDGAEFYLRPEAVTHVIRYPGQVSSSGVGDEVRVFIGRDALVVAESLAEVLRRLAPS